MAAPFLLSAAMLLLGLSLLLITIRAAYSLWLRPRWVEKKLRQQGLKGNRYRFMVGDMKEMAAADKDARSKPMEGLSHSFLPRADPFLSRTLQRYGKRSFVWMGTQARVVIWDPKMLSDILQDKMDQRIQKQPSNPLTRLLTLGLVRLEGDAWAHRRKAITPAFHLEKLKLMIPAFQTSCSKLVERWEGLVAADGSREIDVSPEFQSLTGDVISRTAFGSSFEEGKKIFELQREQVKLVIEAARSFYVPGYRFVPTRKNRRRMQIDREIKTMLRAMIDKKLKAMEHQEPVANDLLGLLVQISSSASPGQSYSVTIDDVMEECKLFYFAGHETTSVWLTWTAVILASNQEWQQRAREEVLAVCGRTAPPTFESLGQLKTVTMILYEVLRLYTPVLALQRMATKTTRIGDFTFAAGTGFVLPIAEMHHSKEFWGYDAEEFKPERFTEGVAKAALAAQGAFFPFGWGPRICLGQNFAVMEAKMVVASLLQRFSFLLPPSYTHAPHTIITLQPQYGAHLVVSRLT